MVASTPLSRSCGTFFIFRDLYNPHMQAVILAGGKGTRLAPLTYTVPKPLLPLSGKPVLDHLLDRLPSEIDDIIVVTGHLGELIEEDVAHKKLPVRTVRQAGIGGTYGALMSARPLLTNRFLVVNGDDLYDTKELASFITHERAFGVYTGTLSGYHAIETDANSVVRAMKPPTPEETTKGFRIATGSYVLDENFFTLPPTQMKNGEYGIPHTLLAHPERYPMTAVSFSWWMPLNTPEDFRRAEELFPEKT